MTSIPSNLARVPNLLSRNIMLNSLTRTTQQLLLTQIQLASGKAINRPSDNPVGASAVSVLDDILERREQRLRNLSHAEAILGNIDQALGDATGILQEAREVGLSQIGIGSDAQTRKNQATVIDAMLDELVSIANRRFQDIHYFGGERTAIQPFRASADGVTYEGIGDGLVTDLGVSNPFAITLAGSDAFGALSERVQGERDFDPGMSASTRLTDLFGANGQGVRRGTINIDVNGNTYALDLTGAQSVGDVMTAIEDLLNTQEPGALGLGGVSVDPVTSNRINVDLNPGFTVTFSDLTGSATAGDLGLSQDAFQDGVNEVGADVDPKLTQLTPIAVLMGVGGPLGVIRISNMGQSRDLDLSGVVTIQGLQNAVAGLNLGVRVEIAESGDRLNFVNELSGGQMSIGEVSAGTTATDLGVRSLSASTRLADFNDGLGVQIRSQSVDPVTGLPDPQADLDFRVTVKDGRFFDVDLAGAETVQDVLDAINIAAAANGLGVPAEFQATLASDGNGIELIDTTTGVTTAVTALNGSFAALDLGILSSTTSATLTGEDRATVAVPSVFSHLLALRDALHANDERGIGLATQRLEGDLERLTRARGDVGVRAQRVTRLAQREEDLTIQDTALRSSIEDLDFTEAAIRLSSLQTQLQAGLAVTVQSLSLSLIDFLR